MLTRKDRPTSARTVLAGTIAAALVVGTQVASKVARDAIFLSTFPTSDLPKVMVAAAVLSLVFAAGATRAMTRFGPARVMPFALVLSGALFVGELLALGRFPRPTALALYLHVATLGGLLVSGFWSVVTERFDPHRAKLVMGKVASGATLGGAIGGLAADGVSRVVGTPGLLVLLTIASVAGALAIERVGRGTRPARDRAPSQPPPMKLSALMGASHLATLGGLGMLAAVWAAFFDYGLKAHVAAELVEPGKLVTFFGWYYTITGVATFAIQSLAGERLLTRYGLTVTVLLLPGFVAVGGLASALVPLLATTVGARGTEMVLSNSLYRSGYELYFTPLAPETKRAAKTLIDVAATRLGDGLGSGLVLGALMLWPAMPVAVPFAAGSVVALGALALLPRLHRGYVAALEEALRAGAVELADDQAALDATTRKTFTDTTQSLDREHLLKEIEAYRAAHALTLGASGSDPKRTTTRSAGIVPPPESIAVHAKADDPRAAATLALLSDDPARIRAVLESGLEPRLARLALPLLSHRSLGALAQSALEAIAGRCVGGLEDALLEESEPRATRVRVPPLLAIAASARAKEALLRGLEADSLEVRLSAGRALAKLARAVPELAPSKADICALIAKSLKLAPEAGRTSHSIRPSIPPSETTLPLPAPISARLDPVILHALTLLTVYADPEALAIAGRALAGTDAALRGTALEYLENVVDEPARELLLARIGSTRIAIPAPRRSERELVEALYKSRAG
ncbi:MAG: hypothetical protein JNL21_30800 [Myxococcales bacterium]|nr:hypothetical protein [Myxococcales bacterium]